MEDFYVEWLVLQNECKMIQVKIFKDEKSSKTVVGKLSSNMIKRLGIVFWN